MENREIKPSQLVRGRGGGSNPEKKINGSMRITNRALNRSRIQVPPPFLFSFAFTFSST